LKLKSKTHAQAANLEGEKICYTNSEDMLLNETFALMDVN
jgi:hypothetical protein